jgi:nucleotide-binding universal stress UspA family protein
MKRILVPVDFSDNTDHACRFALTMAGKTGAEIMLFHSFFDQLYFTDGGFSTNFESGVMLSDEIILDFYRQKEAKLNEIAGEMRQAMAAGTGSGLRISTHMESGDPEVQILKIVEKLKPDLIIMGSSGMGKKSRLSGSVARRVMEHIDVPVIAVADTDVTQTISNIAYMTPFCPDDSAVIRRMGDLLADFNINLFCLHLAESETTPETEARLKSLAEEASLSMPDSRISHHILKHTQDPAELRTFMEEFSIDLIAFIPHKRSFLKNLFYQGLTKADLFLTRIPVMAIKPAAEE